jgi:hypothetical protein
MWGSLGPCVTVGSRERKPIGDRLRRLDQGTALGIKHVDSMGPSVIARDAPEFYTRCDICSPRTH